LFFTLACCNLLWGQTQTSTSSGKWSSSLTWTNGTLPNSPTQNVLISAGTTVTIDAAFACNNLTVEGTLVSDVANTVSSQNLQVTGQIMIKNGGLLRIANDNATVTSLGNANSTVDGTLQIEKGIFNYGLGADKILVGTTGSYVQKGGVSNVNGSLRFSNSATSKFTMSGGNLNIDVQYANNLESATPAFELASLTTASWTSGTVNVINPYYEGKGISFSVLSTNNKTMSSGVLILGNGICKTTGRQQWFTFSTYAPIGTVIINNYYSESENKLTYCQIYSFNRLYRLIVNKNSYLMFSGSTTIEYYDKIYNEGKIINDNITGTITILKSDFYTVSFINKGTIKNIANLQLTSAPNSPSVSPSVYFDSNEPVEFTALFLRTGELEQHNLKIKSTVILGYDAETVLWGGTPYKAWGSPHFKTNLNLPYDEANIDFQYGFNSLKDYHTGDFNELSVGASTVNSLEFRAGLILDRDLTVKSNLNIKSNLTINEKNLTLGTSKTSLGSLNYTSGKIIATTGTFTRWFPTTGLPTATSNSIGYFPMAASANLASRDVNLYFPSSRLASGGTITVGVNHTDGLSSVCPVITSSTDINARTNSSWTITAGNGFATDATNYANFAVVGESSLVSSNNIGLNLIHKGLLAGKSQSNNGKTVTTTSLSNSDFDDKPFYIGANYSNVSSYSSVIAIQPTDQTVTAYSPAVFTTGTQAGKTGYKFKWQVSTNGGCDYTNIDDAVPYTGTANASLTVSQSNVILDKFKYRCMVYSTDQTVYTDPATLTESEIVWTTDNVWSNINGPILGQRARIVGNYNIAKSFECSVLTIDPTGTLEIQNGYYVKVAGTLINNAGRDHLTIKSGGSLLNSTPLVDGTAELSFTCGTSAAPANYKQWHLISTPVDLLQSSTLFDDVAMYTYNERGLNSNTAWPLSNGYLRAPEGYLIYRPQGQAEPQVITKQLKGKLNQGTFTINDLSFSSTLTQHKGFHLVGNPYPSFIDWNEVMKTKVNIDGSIWVWDPSQNHYKTYDGNIAVNEGTKDIPPCQAFFIRVSNSSNSITFSDACREASASSRLLKGGSKHANLLKLKLADKNSSDEMAFYYSSKSSQSPKLFSLDSSVPQIYMSDSLGFNAINSLEGAIVAKDIAVNVNYGSSGPLQISASEFTFDAPVYIGLEDLKLKKTIQLSSNSIYPFEYTVGDKPERFIIHIRPNGIEEKTSDETAKQIYSSGKKVYISLLTSENGNVTICDLLGRPILGKPAVEGLNIFDLTNFPSGVYVVKLSCGNKLITAKVFID